MLEKDETVLFEGRAGYELPVNRGRLTLTDRRLIWERSLSIDPFSEQEVILPLNRIRAVEARGDAIALNTENGEVMIFPQWWVLSIISGNRRTKEWLRELKRAIKNASATPQTS